MARHFLNEALDSKEYKMMVRVVWNIDENFVPQKRRQCRRTLNLHFLYTCTGWPVLISLCLSLNGSQCVPDPESLAQKAHGHHSEHMPSLPCTSVRHGYMWTSKLNTYETPDLFNHQPLRWLFYHPSGQPEGSITFIARFNPVFSISTIFDIIQTLLSEWVNCWYFDACLRPWFLSQICCSILTLKYVNSQTDHFQISHISKCYKLSGET